MRYGKVAIEVGSAPGLGPLTLCYSKDPTQRTIWIEWENGASTPRRCRADDSLSDALADLLSEYGLHESKPQFTAGLLAGLLRATPDV